jgi:hypothetical protein
MLWKKLFTHSKKPQHKIKSLKPKANKGKAMKLSTVNDCPTFKTSIGNKTRATKTSIKLTLNDAIAVK